MGLGIPVVMTNADEEYFLAELKTKANISIFAENAPTKEELWVTGFSADRERNSTYYIWNRAFAWEPKYCWSGAEEKANFFWIGNKRLGPVITYQRARFAKDEVLASGCLSWEIDVPRHRQCYDERVFQRWYYKIVRWVKHNAYLLDRYFPFFYAGVEAFYLPEAMRKYTNYGYLEQRTSGPFSDPDIVF